MPNFEQPPINVPENSEEVETREEAESELSQDPGDTEVENAGVKEEKKIQSSKGGFSRTLKNTLAALTLITAATKTPPAKSAEAEFADKKMDKTEEVVSSENMDTSGSSIENQEKENPLFPTLTRIRLGKFDDYRKNDNQKLVDKLLPMAQLNGWDLDSQFGILNLISEEDLTPEDEAKYIDIVVVDPLLVGLGPESSYQDLVNEMNKRGYFEIKKPGEVLANIIFGEPEDLNLPKDDYANSWNRYRLAMESTDIPAGERGVWHDSRVYIDLKNVINTDKPEKGRINFKKNQKNEDFLPWDNTDRLEDGKGKYKDQTISGMLCDKYFFQKPVPKGNHKK